MTKIIPAILPQTYRDIVASVERIYEAVDTVQIDFVDGTLAPNKTWWWNGKDKGELDRLIHEDEGLPHWDTINYEFDLMLADPLREIDTFVALGPSKIIFHIDTLKSGALLGYFESLPEIVRTTISFGVALNVDSDPAIVAPYSSYIDTIQCMGITQIGFQGQPFDSRVLNQIARVRALYPDKTISVDGAVSVEHVPELVRAGATTLVIGSAIFQSENPHGTIEHIASLCRVVPIASEN